MTLHPRFFWVLSVGLLLLIPVCFWMVTGHVWEDFLITFRQAVNFVEGNGLTYEPGTLLHSFTSPLNVLVPSLMVWLTGSTDYPVPLALYNVLSLSCLVAGGLITLKVLVRHCSGTPLWILLLFPLFLVLSVKVTAYAMNGQESGFWVLFLAVSFAGAIKGYQSGWVWAGIGWGGLMWTRPDSPVHIAVFGLAALLFPLSTRIAEFRGIVRAALICTLVYLPWFCWAWWYYGTPVPHTVLAKVGAYSGEPFMEMGGSEWFGFLVSQFGGAFLPIYSWTGRWSPVLTVGMALCGFAVIASLFFVRDRIVRISAFCFFGSWIYLTWMDATGMAFPWYFPPSTFFGAIALTRLLYLLTFVWLSEERRWMGQVLIAGFVSLFVFSFVGSLRQIEFQQRVVENGVRKQVGLYLRENIEPGDRVFLEPIGYIGYFSGATLLDFPGLVSEKSLGVRRRTGLGFSELPVVLAPEWIVVRPWEYFQMSQIQGFESAYKVVALFDRSEEVRQARFLPGANYPLTDAAFFILKRQIPVEDFAAHFNIADRFLLESLENDPDSS